MNLESSQKDPVRIRIRHKKPSLAEIESRSLTCLEQKETLYKIPQKFTERERHCDFCLRERNKKPRSSAKERHCDFCLEVETRNDAVKMFRNQYDTDVTTWSPAGRLFQVEYAMEAVKQGSAAIGLRSKTHVVLACVNKANSELSSHQKKIFKVDDHIGVAIAGLTADGRVLSRYMRSEAINYNYTYESQLPVGRLVVQLADKAQVKALILNLFMQLIYVNFWFLVDGFCDL